MIINCNSCEKSFVVPDAAITSSGRLVQCSACGNKWTQYPAQKKIKKERKTQIKKAQIVKIPRKKKRKKNDISSFSKEYLNKKYGISINEPSIERKANKTKKIEEFSGGLGFYGILLFFLIIITASFGILNLTKDILIFNFPFLENYILYLYETIDNIKILINDFFNYY